MTAHLSCTELLVILQTESKQQGSTVEPLSTTAEDSKVEKKVEVKSDAEVKSNGAQGGDGKSPRIGSAVVKEEKKKEEEKEEAGSVQVTPMMLPISSPLFFSFLSSLLVSVFQFVSPFE